MLANFHYVAMLCKLLSSVFFVCGVFICIYHLSVCLSECFLMKNVFSSDFLKTQHEDDYCFYFTQCCAVKAVLRTILHMFMSVHKSQPHSSRATSREP